MRLAIGAREPALDVVRGERPAVTDVQPRDAAAEQLAQRAVIGEPIGLVQVLGGRAGEQLAALDHVAGERLVAEQHRDRAGGVPGHRHDTRLREAERAELELAVAGLTCGGATDGDVGRERVERKHEHRREQRREQAGRHERLVAPARRRGCIAGAEHELRAARLQPARAAGVVGVPVGDHDRLD